MILYSYSTTKVFSIFVACQRKVLKYNIRTMMLPPGPKGGLFRNFVGIAGAKRLEWLEMMANKYGDIAHVKLATQDIVLINSPEYAKYVLSKTDVYDKRSIAFKILMKIWGDGLFSSEGKLWQHQRKVMQPFFHKAYLSHFIELMVKSIDSKLTELDEQVRKNPTVDVLELMEYIVLDITMRTLFGTTITKEEVNKIRKIVDNVLHAAHNRIKQAVIPPEIKTFADWKMDKNVTELKRIIEVILKRKRESTDNNRNDLLNTMLLNYEDDEEGFMSHDQLIDEIITFIGAGYETMAHSLAWSWYLILKKPEIYKSLRTVTDDVLKGNHPDFDSIPNLMPIQHAFMESLRLYPTVPIIPRRNKIIDTLDGFHIPKYSEVYINVSYIHRREDQWDNPYTFDPKRFDKSLNHKKRHAFAYIPWSGGVRKCIGYHFSLMEGVLSIAMMLQRFDMELVEKKVKQELTITLRPKRVNVKFTPRVKVFTGFKPQKVTV